MSARSQRARQDATAKPEGCRVPLVISSQAEFNPDRTGCERVACFQQDHPAPKQLSGIYKDCTFFLDGSGLNVLERAETAETEAKTGEIVGLASLEPHMLAGLRPHEPQPNWRPGSA
jgi:hypothetical protein